MYRNLTPSMKIAKKLSRLFKLSILCAFIINSSSCYTDDDLDAADNTRNFYKGRVIDVAGNPVVGGTVVLKSGRQEVARFRTDENGNYEGAGAFYGPFFNLSLLNNSLPTDANGQPVSITRDFVDYYLTYTENIQGQLIELPDLVFSRVSIFNLNIINNSGNSLEINYTYVSADCNKLFENDLEIAGSSCNMVTSGTINSIGNSRGLRLFSVLDSTFILSIFDGTSFTTQTYLIDQPNQNETFIYN